VTKLTTAAVAASAATITSAPGNYPITASGAASPNYIFNYVNGALTVTPLSNANLTNLTVSSGSLSPAFTTGTLNYNVAIENTISALTLTPTYDLTASATINSTAVANASPSYSVPLNVGNNVITLTVIAQDGVTKKIYTVNVYRGLAPTSITASNLLTPNGDGKNDYWIVKDIQLYPNNLVRVYDSAGRVVFAQKGYNNNWGGTLNDTGKPLAIGTYYYAIDLGIGGNVIKGYISIIGSK
jgi:gliding motility-associated-like protein